MIKFTLIENALDSIELGMEYLTKAGVDGNASAYKHALLCLFQGAELLLKETLVIVDPIIIFDKNSLFKYCKSPLRPEIEELYNCRSIDTSGVCEELRKYHPNCFSNSSITTLKSVAKERNKIQHFAIQINLSDLMEKLLRLYFLLMKPAFSIVIENRKNGLETNRLDFEVVCERISSFERKFLHSKMKDEFTTGCCAKCGKFSFFILYDGESFPTHCYCTSCGYEVRDKEPWEYETCPDCGIGSLYYDEELKGGVCVCHKCANSL
ncbi:hypothetical protein [Deefgea rivuli]|uniref:hypothetical protein n=1 Tax=Deefgea rivuli TaxID=400948 RepID=UPI000ABC7B5C|nr:hypothetical protein [Deefgea rivuli]